MNKSKISKKIRKNSHSSQSNSSSSSSSQNIYAKKQRSRSRQKIFRKKISPSLESYQSKTQRLRQQFINLNHLYYNINLHQNIGLLPALWNFCIKKTVRPQKILIICQSHQHLISIRRSYKLYRKIVYVPQIPYEQHSLKQWSDNQTQIVVITKQQFSIHAAREPCAQMFDLIINVSKCLDLDFYKNLSNFIKDRKTIITMCYSMIEFKTFSSKIKIQFNPIQPFLTPEEEQRQIINDIKLAPKPSSSTLQLFSLLDIGVEQVAGKLLELYKIKKTPQKSLFKQMAGYVTFQLNMDIQFNSLKYVWNFLKKQTPKIFYQQIRGMQKNQSQTGVVINIPEQQRIIAELVSQKFRKQKKNCKQIQLKECFILPKLEDIQSQQYKILKEKKKIAIQQKDKLQIFIGGIAYDMNQLLVKQFFRKNGVNLFLVRILKDDKGFSKGIAFGLCQNQQHYQRALKLNGTRIMDRNIRIKLADQRKT